jgi:hypothetical protein
VKIYFGKEHTGFAVVQYILKFDGCSLRQSVGEVKSSGNVEVKVLVVSKNDNEKPNLLVV